MKLPSPPMIIFWLCMLVAPFIVTAVSLSHPSAGYVRDSYAGRIDGHVNRMASPSDLWALSLCMSFCNGLMALCYCANDFLFAHGLVNGVKKRSTALKVDIICAIFFGIVQAACTAFLLSLI